MHRISAILQYSADSNDTQKQWNYSVQCCFWLHTESVQLFNTVLILMTRRSSETIQYNAVSDYTQSVQLFNTVLILMTHRINETIQYNAVSSCIQNQWMLILIAHRNSWTIHHNTAHRMSETLLWYHCVPNFQWCSSVPNVTKNQ